MPLESHYPIVQHYFDGLMNSVQHSSPSLYAGDYYGSSHEEEALTEIHHLESSKASQMIHLNIKHRV